MVMGGKGIVLKPGEPTLFRFILGVQASTTQDGHVVYWSLQRRIGSLFQGESNLQIHTSFTVTGILALTVAMSFKSFSPKSNKATTPATAAAAAAAAAAATASLGGRSCGHRCC